MLFEKCWKSKTPSSFFNFIYENINKNNFISFEILINFCGFVTLWAFQFLIFILMWPGVIRLIFLVFIKEFLWMCFLNFIEIFERTATLRLWFNIYLIGLLKIYKMLECLRISKFIVWRVWLLLSRCII